MKKFYLIISFVALFTSLSGCGKRIVKDAEPINVGEGYESHVFHAPWSGLDNDTRFCCHQTENKFFFSYEVEDSTLTLTEPFTKEADVEPEDRVEIFFSPTHNLKSRYYCAEIDPKGRVLDYSTDYYRKFDYNWNFTTLKLHTQITSWGYRVGGSIDLAEFDSLGINKDEFWMGVFQADFNKKGDVFWYSLHSTDQKKADFHKPDVFFKCKMTPRKEYHGMVIYPSDVISVGVEEWRNRIVNSKINLIGLHAATFNEPVDELKDFVKSETGQDFLQMCSEMNVDVEYEIHSLQYLLPRDMFASHPEYFPKNKKGERQQEYNACFTSDGAVEAMRPQIDSLMKWMKPTTHRYYLWTDDGKPFCYCEKCREYSHSEQSLILENKLLDILKEYDSKATLAHLAYHKALDAPKKVKAKEGIFLEFAPISRDYSLPLPEKEKKALEDNLLVFPVYSAHILEYWLDESMFSKWERENLVEFPDNSDRCREDVRMYRDLGARSITCFATWLNDDYIKQFGPTDRIFQRYSTAF